MVKVLLLFLGSFFCFQSVQAQSVPERLRPNHVDAEIDSLERLLKNTPQETLQVEILYELSTECLYTSDKKALYYAQRALWLAEKNKFRRGIALSYLALGGYNSYKNNFTHAMDHYLTALGIFDALQDKQGSARVYCSIGAMYYMKQDDKQAYEYIMKAWQLEQFVKDPRQRQELLHDIGLLYCKRKQYAKAMNYILQALKLARQVGDPIDIAFEYRGIGRVYEGQEKYAEAILCHSRALRIFDSLGGAKGYVWSLKNLGHIHQHQKRYIQALQYYEKGLAVAKLHRMTTSLMDYYQGISQCHAGLENYQRAYEYNLQYMQMKDSIFNNDREKTIAELETRYETNRKQAHIELLQKDQQLQQEAYAKQRIFLYSVVLALLLICIFAFFLYNSNSQKRKINDLLSVRNEEIVAQKQEIEGQNAILIQQRQEIEMHMDEIEAQSQQLHQVLIQMENQNQQLQNSEIELLKLNSVKNKYFSILAHDLRNAFAALKVYLPLLELRLDRSEDQGLVELFSEFKHSVKNINSLLDNVLIWSLSQMNMMPTEERNLSLKQCADQNLDLVMPTAQASRIVLENNIQAEVIVRADENMLNSVLRNLLSNALKFTPAGGRIIMSASIHETEVEVSVQDSGPGIPLSDQSRLFQLSTNHKTSKPGKGTGLGLVICKEFVEKNGGRIHVESLPGEGSRFVFTLPLVKNSGTACPVVNIATPGQGLPFTPMRAQ